MNILQMGKVHPATGYVKAEIDGQEVFYQTVRTDMEEIWDVYQKEVLPDCRRYIEEKTAERFPQTCSRSSMNCVWT